MENKQAIKLIEKIQKNLLQNKFDLNETIPEELYTVVAEVFAFIYRLDKEEQKRNYKINKDR